jgi:hypothetical protein
MDAELQHPDMMPSLFDGNQEDVVCLLCSSALLMSDKRMVDGGGPVFSFPGRYLVLRRVTVVLSNPHGPSQGGKQHWLGASTHIIIVPL